MSRILIAGVIIFIGLLMLPALFCMVLGLGATLIAFLLNPKVIIAMIIGMGIVCLPGIIIGWIAKR